MDERPYGRRSPITLVHAGQAVTREAFSGGFPVAAAPMVRPDLAEDRPYPASAPRRLAALGAVVLSSAC